MTHIKPMVKVLFKLDKYVPPLRSVLFTLVFVYGRGGLGEWPCVYGEGGTSPHELVMGLYLRFSNQKKVKTANYSP